MMIISSLLIFSCSKDDTVLVHGTIYDQSSNPIGDVVVSVYAETFNASHMLGSTMTSSIGVYSLEVQPLKRINGDKRIKGDIVNEYKITFSHPNYKTSENIVSLTGDERCVNAYLYSK